MWWKRNKQILLKPSHFSFTFIHCLLVISSLLALSFSLSFAEPTQPSPIQEKRAIEQREEQVSFDENRAFEFLKSLVDRGQRYYGAPKRAEIIEWLAQQLKTHGAQIELQSFEQLEVKSGTTYPLTNIIARFNPERSQRVILGSHWDTRLWAEEDHNQDQQHLPITGANDGSSGVAVLLEIATQYKQSNLQNIGLDLVLFDGEEFGRPGSNDYCVGSKYFTRQLKSYYPTQKPIAVIVIDMVGDRDLAFPPEQSSVKYARSLTTLIWREAIKLNLEAFKRGLERGSPHARSQWIIDDHSPFQELGIPSVLIIDLNYPHWHTHQDQLDKVSAKSLAQAGRALQASLKALDNKQK